MKYVQPLCHQNGYFMEEVNFACYFVPQGTYDEPKTRSTLKVHLCN